LRDFVVFDFEAIPDPENPPPPPREGAPEQMPAAPHHLAVSGAILPLVWTDHGLLAYPPRLLGGKNGGDERAILEDFVELVAKPRRGGPFVLVSWNGRGFDLPFVVARCMRHGIVAPWLWDRDYQDRFRGELHLDLQDATSFMGAARAARMASFAKLCGWPGKVGIDGSDVPEAWAAGPAGQEIVRAYNLADVVQEAAILLRLMLCRGWLSPEGYGKVAQQLLSIVDADPRFGPVVELLDRERFLLAPAPPADAGEPA
jgi:hypothetical protein